MAKEPTDSESFVTPTTWLNCAHVERWLRMLWPGWRMDDVRHEWDHEGRWYWIVPDFSKGRSRVLGVQAALLEQVTLSRLRDALEQAHWFERIESEHLLVVRDDAGRLRVTTWKPRLDEKWFIDPRGGYYVAFPTWSHYLTTALPTRSPQRFLALHGATWSAKGPERPRDVTTYTEEELRPYLPATVRADLQPTAED